MRCQPRTAVPRGRPQLTVVIPAWDLAGELGECLASIAAEPEECEVIVVDNASTLRLEVPAGIRVVRSEIRVSLAGARNLGLAQVTTPFVCFIDADDVLIPPALQQLTAVLRREPQIILAAGGSLIWDPETDCRIPSYVPSRLACLLQGYPLMLALLQGYPLMLALLQATSRVLPTAGASVLRTDVLRRLGAFPDVPVGENWALGVTLALAGRVRLCRQPMKLYRVQQRRPMLSAVRARSLGQGLDARRAMRVALRDSPRAGVWLLIVSYLLVPLARRPGNP